MLDRSLTLWALPPKFSAQHESKGRAVDNTNYLTRYSPAKPVAPRLNYPGTQRSTANCDLFGLDCGEDPLESLVGRGSFRSARPAGALAFMRNSMHTNRRHLHALALVVLSLAALALYKPILVDWFWSLYDDPTYSYGLLVPFLAAYVVFQKIRRTGPAAVATIAYRPSYLAYPVIGAGAFLLIVGEVSTLLYLARLSFLLTLGGILLAAIGRRGVSTFRFPAAYLLFALPLPTLIYLPLSGSLQSVSSVLAGKSLDLLGVPAIREGNIITLPTTQLEVAEACSGIHSLFALLAVATLGGYLLRRRNAEGVLIALSAIPLAVVLNAARVTSLGVLSYQVGPGATAGFAHMTTGSVVFLIGCALIFGLCLMSGKSSGAHRITLVESPAKGRSRTTFAWLNVAAAFALLGLAVALRGNVGFDKPVLLRQPLSNLPLDLAGWRGRDVPIPKTQLVVLRASAVLLREYTRPADPPLTLYVAYFAAQREGTAMHSPLHCMPGAGWQVERQSVVLVSEPALPAIQANQVVFVSNRNRMLVVYFYIEQGAPEQSELQGALATLRHAVFERRSDGCLIRVSAPILESEQKTLNEELTFIGRSVPLLLDRFLPGRASVTG
jgi:exosortase D (VPLPA-CTERM-specific)